MDSSGFLDGLLNAEAIPLFLFCSSLLFGHLSKRRKQDTSKDDRNNPFSNGEEYKVDRAVDISSMGNRDIPQSPSHTRTTTDKRNTIRAAAVDGTTAFLTPNKIEKENMVPIFNRIQQSFSCDGMDSDGRAGMNPLVLGIAGGTASGKTTLSQAIYKAIGPESITFITHDCYYKDLSHLSLKEREVANFDHPDSLDTSLLIEHIKQLKSLQAVRLPTYDYSTHSRLPGLQEALPRNIILIEGILIFHDPALVDLMDIKVFVDTDDDIRLARRIQRDTVERGRTVESVLTQYFKTVRPMHLQFVESSKRKADIIVPTGLNSVALDLVVSKLKYTLSMDTNIGDSGKRQ